MRTMFKSKIHRAVVTHADVDYEGSLSIDLELMEAADIVEFERVELWNVTRGTRLSTYAIEAPRHSGVICANGAAAHLNEIGDLVIIATFEDFETVPKNYKPTVVLVDEKNRMQQLIEEQAGPAKPERVL